MWLLPIDSERLQLLSVLGEVLLHDDVTDLLHPLLPLHPPSLRPCPRYNPIMDEGTMKTPIPKCRLYWCFCLGWCGNFVNSKSGQKQRVKLLLNMAYNITQHPSNLPQRHTVCTVYTVRLLWERGGRGGGGQREGRGPTVY